MSVPRKSLEDKLLIVGTSQGERLLEMGEDFSFLPYCINSFTLF